MERMLEKVEYGLQLRFGEMTISLGNADQDIHQEMNKTIMGLGLGLLIGCGPVPDIPGKAEKGREQKHSTKQNSKDKKRKETAHSLPATSGQQDEDDNEKATTTAGLVTAIIVLALHEEGREKVAESKKGDQGT
jgi:hypothetical protein